MQYNVNGNGIQQGFANLAQIFAPNAAARIDADLAAKRGETLQAQADLSRTNARIASATDARAAETHTNLMNLGGALTGIDVSTPEGRALLIGTLGAAGLDLNSPSTSAGYATLINPQFVGPNDLANVFVGTGAVDAYSQTQPGQAQAEDAARLETSTRQAVANAGALEVQNAADAAALERLQFQAANPGAGAKPPTPITVDPTDVAKLRADVETTLTSLFPNTDVPDALMQEILGRVGSEYQRTRNSAQAISSVIEAMNLSPTKTEARIWPGNSHTLSAGAPPASPQTQPTVQEGQTATGPNGEKIVFQGGQWVPLR